MQYAGSLNNAVYIVFAPAIILGSVVSGSSAEVGVPVCTCPSREEIERVAQASEPLARDLWVGCLLSEYRALQLARLGVRLVQVEVKPVALPTASSNEVRSIYSELRSARERGASTMPAYYAKLAYDKGDPGYFFEAARELNRALSGGRDKFISIAAYAASTKELELSAEDAERVEKLAGEVLKAMTPLGGAVEEALLKLITTGYRRGVASTIEGLGEDAKRLLEELLDKPFERAALLYAYRRLVGYRRMMQKLLKPTIHPDTGRHTAISYWLLEPEKISV